MQTTTINSGWTCLATAPDAAATPSDLATSADWLTAQVPGTVAGNHQALASLDQAADMDQKDWWFQTEFDAPSAVKQVLEFAGLATLAQVWVNGSQILAADNMFRRWQIDCDNLVGTGNRLHLVFRSVSHELSRKRPRPRWKTRLVQSQRLRWIRTALFGRVRHWGEINPFIGPWRSIRLHSANCWVIRHCHVHSHRGNESCRVHICARIAWLGSEPPQRIYLRFDGQDYELPATQDAAGEICLNEVLELGQQPLWFPHTCGTPERLPWELNVAAATASFCLGSGMLGFRSARLTLTGDASAMLVNGQPEFCRGACWTVPNWAGDRTPEQLRASLVMARDCGLNMLRIPGTMVYEEDLFYDVCDELGIMVWQDFMLASMDYPQTEDFIQNLSQEIEDQVTRLRSHPCVVVFCANSEVHQQACMLGLSVNFPDAVQNTIRSICKRLVPDLPFFPSTPAGGDLPIHTATGLAHYYGIGAYRRPLDDPGLDRLIFSPECLGFSHVPDPAHLARHFGDVAQIPESGRWLAGIPQDPGTAWNFQDVRDFYLEQMFDQSAQQLRQTQPDRYLDISRAVTGEIATRVFSQLRASRSRCAGALVWFFQDLIPGAGWGLVDCDGNAKPVMFYLKRVWGAQVVLLSDRGLDGLELELLNDSAEPFRGTVSVSLLRSSGMEIATQSEPVEIAQRARITLSADGVLKCFYDVGYAYRFGPPQHDVVAARLVDTAGKLVSEAFWFPAGYSLPENPQADITCTLQQHASGCCLRLRSNQFLQSAQLVLDSGVATVNYVHMAPKFSYLVPVRKLSGASQPAVLTIRALNLADAQTIKLSAAPE